VVSVLGQRFPITLELVLVALVLALCMAVPVALLAAYHPRGVADRISAFVSMVGLSVPGFAIGLVLILVFAVHARVLPATGFVALRVSVWGNIRSILLPSLTIAIGLFAGYSRLLRADLVEQMLSEDYVETARAKGVRRSRVLVKHALRNSAFGLLTLVGVNIGTLIGATVIVETVFALPGIGQLLVNSILDKDATIVQGTVVVLALAVVLANLVVDLLYAVLDPRVRYGRPSV
jgi:peptide/nickel transport system permease protein